MLVDEFQDTNPLQNEILELLDRDNLFRVGDERQSIYRFRHADVKVFRDASRRRRREARARASRSSVNFRSRGEVLDAIDLAFGRAVGRGLRARCARRPARATEPPRVGAAAWSCS